MKLEEYLQGVVSEYAPHIKKAATGLALKKLARVDQALRNPDTLGNILENVLGGIAESWRACPHGTPRGEVCEKCPKDEP